MNLFNMLIKSLQDQSRPLTLGEQVLLQVSEALDEEHVLTLSKADIAHGLECHDERLRELVVEQTFAFLMGQGLLVHDGQRYRLAA